MPVLFSAVVLAAVTFPIPDAVTSHPAPEKNVGKVKAVFIESVPWKGKDTRFFAYYGLPTGASATNRVPGIVLVHGGGGTAFFSWVKTWNARGYAAIAMDNCGGVPGTSTHCPRHPRHAWSGPNGWGCFEDEGLAPEDQWMYHAVESVIRSHTFLRKLPEVDAARIGVTGISWGGVLTAVVCGVDPRFAFAVPVYGCGNLRGHSVWSSQVGSRWDALWDPLQYVSRCRIPTLWCTGTNDHFFPLDSFVMTALAAGDPLFSIKVRMIHAHPPAGDPPEITAFADSLVRGAVQLNARPISREEWVFTESSSTNWESRPFRSSGERPMAATYKFRNRQTADGLVLSELGSPGECAFDRSVMSDARERVWH